MKNTILAVVIGLSLSSFGANAAITVAGAAKDLNLTELAQTYTPEQILAVTGNDKGNQFDALFIDIGVINQADLATPVAKMKKINAFIKDQNNLAENYLGYVNDNSLVERVKKAWQQAKAIDDKATLDVLNSLIDKGYTTGYNLVSLDDQSNFDADLSIKYGHSNIDHAVQLLYLMKREGFNPKVQFTPKTSAFIYLPEWGEPSYPVQQMPSGKTVAMATEYNLEFEFSSKASKEKFMDLINTYAKKDAENEQGLLIESWWQPFYRSYNKIDGYEVLAENRVMLNGYQADLMVLADQAKQQQQQIALQAGKENVTTHKVWVNPSFYRYMQGDFK